MAIRNVAATAVLGLLFVSLVVIYLMIPQNTLVTFLSLLIMLVSLIVAQSRSWRDIGIMAVFAGLVSLVAAGLVGNAVFGGAGRIIVPLVWLVILFAMFTSSQRALLPVPRDRAILVVNRFTGTAHAAEGPIAPPLIPGVEQQLAVIPLYELSTDKRVDKINTRARHNIDGIEVHIHYQVKEASRALGGIPNRSQAQNQIAKDLNKDLREARLDVTFWEKLLNHQMELEVEDIVRSVIYNNVIAQNALEIYNKREELAEATKLQLSKLVHRWGIEIIDLEFDRIDVNPDVFKGINKAFVREDETLLEKIKAEREASHIRLVGEARTEAETKRITQMIQTLRETGADLSADDLRDIVIDAIRYTTEMNMESAFMRAIPEPAPAPKPAGDSKDNGSKK
ncbi:MAG: hypothetical protein IPO81_12425 [Kouleothrix sp.]|nr:hypothetical protein [Kouleothrix sp.]